MTRRGRSTWGMAAFAVLAAMVAGGEARAAGVRIPIITPSPVGDPIYESTTTVDLLAGSTLINGGYFTIYDIPALTAISIAQGPNLSWGASVQLIGETPSGASVTDDPALYNVTFQYNGVNPIVAGSSDLSLGTFRFGPTGELSSPPAGTVTYVSSLNGTTVTNEGTVTIASVPEPASIILMSTAAVFVLAVSARGRRHQPAAPAA